MVISRKWRKVKRMGGLAWLSAGRPWVGRAALPAGVWGRSVGKQAECPSI